MIFSFSFFILNSIKFPEVPDLGVSRNGSGNGSLWRSTKAQKPFASLCFVHLASPKGDHFWYHFFAKAPQELRASQNTKEIPLRKFGTFSVPGKNHPPSVSARPGPDSGRKGGGVYSATYGTHRQNIGKLIGIFPLCNNILLCV